VLFDPRGFAQIRNITLVMGGLAWSLLVILPLLEPGSQLAHSHGHAAHPEITPAGMPHDGWQLAAANWLLMLVAMMAPVLAPAIYHIRVSSLSRRRTRSTLLFVAGYAGVWIAAGAVLLSLVDFPRAIGLPPYMAAAALLAFALVWQFSPFKQTCLNRCHEQPSLDAFGRGADRDVLRYGVMHGTWCAGSCWAWMTLPMLLPQGHLPAMGLAALLIYCERLDRPQPQRWQLRGFGRAMRLVVGRSQMWLHADRRIAVHQAVLAPRTSRSGNCQRP